MNQENIAALKQPKAMYLLIAVQMWESFSYYGMRAILVLYMIHYLKFSDHQAFSIYAIYIGLVEGLGIFGGQLADKVFGMRNSIYVGGFIIAFGHGVMAFPYYDQAIYIGLAAISVGAGLFRTSTAGLLGAFYKENDLRRDAGFTYYYVGLNLGAFLATILCVHVSQLYGWHYGFSLAGFGMVIGMLNLHMFRALLEDKGLTSTKLTPMFCYKTAAISLAVILAISVFIFFHETTIYILTAFIIAMLCRVYWIGISLQPVQRNKVHLALLAILLAAIFYSFEGQIGSSLIIFGDRFSDKIFFGLNIDVASLTSVNPIVVLLFGPIVAFLLELYEVKVRHPINIFIKISLAFIVQAAAFIVLYLYSVGVGYVSAEIIALVFGVIALSELFIGPAVYSYASEAAPQTMRAMMMGAVMLGFALSNVSSGFVSEMMAFDSNSSPDINVYSLSFMKIGVACAIFAGVILFLKTAHVGHKVYKKRKKSNSDF
ncbi:MAG: peptide MFS transporter [Alphaproteobacteria bacterium]